MINKIPSLLFIVLVTFFPGASSFAIQAPTDTHLAGQLAKYEGTVLIRADESAKPQQLDTIGASLLVGNQLRTKSDSRAYVKWIDGSKIVMKEKSQLSIKAIDNVDVDSGMVLFDISKIERPQPVRVGVRLAILGVRGTRFIVNTSDDEYKVYLKEGSVAITSLKEDFKVYKEQIEAQMKQFREQIDREAKEYKSQLEKGFEEYKQQARKGKVELVKEFELVEAAGISVKDNVITLVPIPKEIEEEFKLLDSF